MTYYMSDTDSMNETNLSIRLKWIILFGHNPQLHASLISRCDE